MVMRMRFAIYILVLAKVSASPIYENNFPLYASDYLQERDIGTGDNDQLPAPAEWVKTITGQCQTSADVNVPLHEASNRGPSSASECAHDDAGLKVKRVLRDRSRHVYSRALEPRDGEGSQADNKMQGGGSNQIVKVCTWMYLGLTPGVLGDACDTAEMVIESGKEVLLAWGFNLVVDHIIVWVTQSGQRQQCFAYQRVEGLNIGYTRFQGFVAATANYHFEFIFKTAEKLTKGRVGAWKRAGL